MQYLVTVPFMAASAGLPHSNNHHEPGEKMIMVYSDMKLRGGYSREVLLCNQATRSGYPDQKLMVVTIQALGPEEWSLLILQIVVTWQSEVIVYTGRHNSQGCDREHSLWLIPLFTLLARPSYING
jgi:hypothetical protein